MSAIEDRNELNELCADCVICDGYSRYAVAQVAAQVMTDQQDLRKIRETANEMIADREVTAKIDPMTGEVRYRVAYRRV